MSKIDVLRKTILESNIDVLCVTESWLHGLVSDNMINIEGFRLCRNDRTYSRGGGTCIYINNRLKYTSSFNSVNNKDIELQMITLLGNSCNARCKEINIVVACRPPSGNSKSGKEQLITYCESLPDNLHRELILLGDLNWDISRKNIPCDKIVTDIEETLGVEELISC